MIAVTGRLAAAALLTLSGAFIAVTGVLIGVTDRFTGHEALAGFTALVVAAGSAAWLRRDKHRRRQS